jgi:hypothetical protein
VFAPIWKDPWMTFDARTYANDLLARIGADNVFAQRQRRFPLAADLGDATPIDPGDRDTRYPRIAPNEVCERAPKLVLLSDEPYAFGGQDEAEMKSWGLSAAIEHVSGKDLFWYGARTASAMERLASVVRRNTRALTA